MTRLVLISDLHFGRDEPDLLEPLTHAIREVSPDLVLMAGDFVQRARASQFSRARAFMDGLGPDWIGVPGNHDLPLYNIFQRVFDPYRGYRHWIGADREPRVELANALVLGLDTTDPHAHQRGRVRQAAVARIAQDIATAGPRLPVILAHHPFHHAPHIEKKLMVGAPAALEHWAESGPHIILSGHLHRWLFEPFIRREGKNMTLQLHCGTGLSQRRRGEPNDFAILDCTAQQGAGQAVKVTRMVAADGRFILDAVMQYQATEDGWQRSDLP